MKDTRVRSAEYASKSTIPTQTTGEVAERSNAADCKSVALVASKVRVLPSPPAFARSSACELRFGSQVDVRRAGFDSASQPGVRKTEWMARGLASPERRGKREGARREGGSNSVVESQPSKLLVAGSIPVSRSRFDPGTSSSDPYRRRSPGPQGPAPLRRHAPLARIREFGERS